jgi:hypothetical protein
MQGEDDLRGLAKIMAFACYPLPSCIFLLEFCYSLEKGWTLQIINKILGNFQRTASLSYHIHQDFALVLLALSCLGNKRSQNEKLVGLK